MKTTTFVNATVLAAGLTLGANTLTAAPPPTDWIEQHFKAKYGRNTPVEEARQRAEQANSAFRVDPHPGDPAPHWMEQHLRAKTGRYSQAEEARQQDLRNSSAFRAEPSPVFDQDWVDQHRMRKQGQ